MATKIVDESTAYERLHFPGDTALCHKNLNRTRSKGKDVAILSP